MRQKCIYQEENLVLKKGIERFSESIAKHIESLQKLLLLQLHHQRETEERFFSFSF